MINKDIFLKSLICHTQGWYFHYGETQSSATAADQFRMKQGIKIGEMARTLYSHGKLVDEGSNLKNSEKTQVLIGDAAVNVIFEGTFIYNNFIAKADILERINGEWHLIEVKSSVADGSSTNIKNELIDDLTYTALILSLYGIELKKMSLMLVSKNYKNGMSNNDFFVEVDCTEKVYKHLPYFKNRVNAIQQTMDKPEKPDPKLIFQCKNCDFYEAYCLGKEASNSIFDLPRLSEKKFNQLTEEGIFTIDEIPDHFDLSDTQKKVWNVVQDNRPYINKNKLKDHLERIILPAYYLDFESVSTAIPLYQNIRPYQEIVTQYSIHSVSNINKQKHHEFLADYTKDDRRAIAEKLLLDIGKEGSVIVYHAQAEKRFISSLAAAVPDLTVELNKIIKRIVDLKVILQETYYHPSFHGSYSIKVVLPVLVPEMSYKSLTIGDGQSASVVFAELAQGIYPKEDAVIMREKLLEYCKQDTVAMVKIHNTLSTMID